MVASSVATLDQTLWEHEQKSSKLKCWLCCREDQGPRDKITSSCSPRLQRPKSRPFYLPLTLVPSVWASADNLENHWPCLLQCKWDLPSIRSPLGWPGPQPYSSHSCPRSLTVRWQRCHSSSVHSTAAMSPPAISYIPGADMMARSNRCAFIVHLQMSQPGQ